MTFYSSTLPIDTNAFEPKSLIYPVDLVGEVNFRGLDIALTPEMIAGMPFIEFVPFVHQLWDTPNNHNGHWSCGVAVVLMYLAYYRMLTAKPITVNVPSPHVSPFGHYASEPFSFYGGYCDNYVPTPTGKAAGVYGKIVDKIGSSYGTHYHSPSGQGLYPFLAPVVEYKFGNKLNLYIDRPAGSRFLEREPTLKLFEQSLTAGHPVLFSGFFENKYDHLALLTGLAKVNGETHLVISNPYGTGTDKSFDGNREVVNWDRVKPKWGMFTTGDYVPQYESSGLTFAQKVMS